MTMARRHRPRGAARLMRRSDMYVGMEADSLRNGNIGGGGHDPVA